MSMRPAVLSLTSRSQDSEHAWQRRLITELMPLHVPVGVKVLPSCPRRTVRWTVLRQCVVQLAPSRPVDPCPVAAMQFSSRTTVVHCVAELHGY